MYFAAQSQRVQSRVLWGGQHVPGTGDWVVQRDGGVEQDSSLSTRNPGPGAHSSLIGCGRLAEAGSTEQFY